MCQQATQALCSYWFIYLMKVNISKLFFIFYKGDPFLEGKFSQFKCKFPIFWNTMVLFSSRNCFHLWWSFQYIFFGKRFWLFFQKICKTFKIFFFVTSLFNDLPFYFIYFSTFFKVFSPFFSTTEPRLHVSKVSKRIYFTSTLEGCLRKQLFKNTFHTG